MWLLLVYRFRLGERLVNNKLRRTFSPYFNPETNRSIPFVVKLKNPLVICVNGRAVMNTAPIAKVLGGPTGHFPVEAEIVGYLANSWSVPTLLGVFAAGWVVILGATHVMVKRHNPTLSSGDKAAILWFVLSRLNKRDPRISGSMLNHVHYSRYHPSIL